MQSEPQVQKVRAKARKGETGERNGVSASALSPSSSCKHIEDVGAERLLLAKVHEVAAWQICQADTAILAQEATKPKSHTD